VPLVSPSPGSSLDDRPPRIRWRLIALLFVFATVARFAYFYLDDLTRGHSGTLGRRLMEEGTGGLASALLFWLAVVVERHFPLDRGRWRRSWLPHVGGYVAYSVAHTTMMAGMRAVLFPAVGYGAYDYGIMSVRYFMEAAQDLISYLTFLGIITLFRVQQQLHERELRSAALERDAANARLEVLSMRLQPHFLFNALNTISSTVYDDPATADDLIGHLGELLRRSLRTSDRQEIPLREELEVLRAYQALVEARFGDRIHFALDISGDALPLGVPAFLLQPLVENAVHHGASLEYGNSTILVTAAVERDILRLVVDNDAPATDCTPSRVGTGLGATRDRLRLLYGDAGVLETSAAGGRFRVTVCVPAHVVPPGEMPSEVQTHPELPESSPARAHR
jgi:two-component system LytT family sensor kinase